MDTLLTLARSPTNVVCMDKAERERKRHMKLKKYIDKVKSRYDFPILLDAIDAKVGIELGVDRGDFSNHLIENYKGWEMLYGVDEYVERFGASGDFARDEKMYLETLNRFSSKENYSLMKMTFSAAVEKFPDEFFDFIFIDGNSKNGQEKGTTFNDWWPKLKVGGVFAGRAYCRRRYPRTFKNIRKFRQKMDHCSSSIYLVDDPKKTDKDFVPNWCCIKLSADNDK